MKTISILSAVAVALLAPASVLGQSADAPTRTAPTREEVLAAMHSVVPLVRRCVPEPDSAITVRVTFGADGSVTSSEPTGAAAADATITDCVRAALSHASVPPFADDHYVVEYPFRFVPTAPESDGSAASPASTATSRMSDVRQAVGRAGGGIDECWFQAITRNHAHAAEHVRVHVEVDRGGQVTGANTSGSNDDALASCVTRWARQITVGPGDPVGVDAEFDLRPVTSAARPMAGTPARRPRGTPPPPESYIPGGDGWWCAIPDADPSALAREMSGNNYPSSHVELFAGGLCHRLQDTCERRRAELQAAGYTVGACVHDQNAMCVTVRGNGQRFWFCNPTGVTAVRPDGNASTVCIELRAAYADAAQVYDPPHGGRDRRYEISACGVVP